MVSSGIGRAVNSRRHGLAIHRAQFAERPTRALSVAMPVLAYICRYSFEISTKASLDLSDLTQCARSQMLPEAVEPVPCALRAAPDVVGRHRRMRGVDLRPQRLRNQPVARQRCPVDSRRVLLHLLLPGGEVGRAGIRREHHELREGDARLLRHLRRWRRTCVPRSLGSPKMNEPSTWTPWCLKARRRSTSCVARGVEALVDVLQPFRRDRLDADERALDPGLAHGVQELRILGGLHRDLREEHHVVRQFGQPAHQLETLGADGAQRLELRLVRAPRRPSADRSASPDRSCRPPAR